MNIIISGYGRMGKEVEKIALQRKHRIIARFDTEEEWEQLDTLKQDIDVVVDFSFPETAVKNIKYCFRSGIPVVTGTTGWYDELDEIKKQCNNFEGTLFYAPNFSIGINLFFRANKQLAKLMKGVEGYQVSMKETHHIHKLDAPSGTAIKAAEDIIEANDELTSWVNRPSFGDGALPILSHREGEIPGTHEVIYESDADLISLKHEAKNRSGFALGAVLAAEFSVDKKGVFTMDELLQFG